MRPPHDLTGFGPQGPRVVPFDGGRVLILIQLKKAVIGITARTRQLIAVVSCNFNYQLDRGEPTGVRTIVIRRSSGIDDRRVDSDSCDCYDASTSVSTLTHRVLTTTGDRVWRDASAAHSAPLDLRSQAILRAVIEEYVSTAQPVGSQALVERYGLGRLERDGSQHPG